MELIEKNEDLYDVKISFLGKIKTISCKLYMTFKELIELFLKKNLKDKYNLDKLTLTINGEVCFLEKNLETHKDEILNNDIFILNYNKGVQEEENKEQNDFPLIIGGGGNEFDSENTVTELELKFPVFKGIKRCRDITKDIEQICKVSKPINLYDEDKFFDMEINIKFFKIDKNHFKKNYAFYLSGLLKLCLLKEIALKYDINNCENIPDYLLNILKILRRGKISYNDIKQDILKVLKKIKGSNIINFSRYVNDLITQIDIYKYLIPRLDSKTKNEIIYINNCLGQYIEYNKIFEEEFERAKRNSVFEYSIISLTIIEREDINEFESNRKKCKNRVDRILFHGTSHHSISKILTDLFKRANNTQHGKGVYFTEDLDSCWIYGSENYNKNPGNNKRNLNIPKVGECFSLIASGIYYNKKGFKRVYNDDYTPKTNEINFAYAGMNELETILDKEPEKTKFYGTEYVINDLNQICPFMSLKLKRDEYCVIWRDNNFSNKPIYGNEYDVIFKKFLKERIKYINQMGNFNIYPCESSEEALKLIKRKKYNKIILISNVGKDLGGKEFINMARNVIGNDVISLFLAYDIDHLEWIKNYKNALFSNEPEFYEKYLNCFYDKNLKECKQSIIKLKENMEKHYGVKFNFDDKFLDYPYYNDKKIKKFKDLVFDN